MGSLTIKSLITEADYEDNEKDVVINNAKVTYDVEGKKISRLSCDVHKKSDNTWLGGVSTEILDGKMKHNFSGVDLDNVTTVKECIAEIEAEVVAANATEEEPENQNNGETAE